MDICKSEMINVHKDPFFHSSARKSSSITQNEGATTQSTYNCDYNNTQGVCDLELYDDVEEANNNIYPPDELYQKKPLMSRLHKQCTKTIPLRNEVHSVKLDVVFHKKDIASDEFDSNRKEYKRTLTAESDSEGFDVANGQPVESCTLSAVYRAEWPIDRMYWSEDSDSAGTSSMEAALQQDTASIMSFDSSMTTSSMANQMSGKSDQSNAKADLVYTLMSMLQTHDKMEVTQMLLSMSTSRENCIAMIESGCLPLLVQLLHQRNEKQTFLESRKNAELRKRASQILNNVVYFQPEDKKRMQETRVLRLLDEVRNYCDFLKSSPYEVNDNDNARGMVQQIGSTVATLMKLSFDEEHRHAMCLLGGLQAIAELIEIDQEIHGCTNDPQCITIRRYSGMALTNLTFGDGTNKALLCSMKPFMQALVAQLYSPSEELRQVSASVLRNLSWRADTDSKLVLREVGAVTTLMKAAMEATKEATLKSILSALWNLSAHCSENKADICRIDGALGFLVSTLSYKSTKNLAVVENGGGILRNISSHIALQNDHRITLRKHNCLQILLQHLKSPSLTVVSNACGTLWNLSARNAQDQRTLWEMGAVGMLKKLVNSKHKMISMGSSAALKNLLSAMPPGLNTGFGIPGIEYNPNAPSLHVRKQKVFNTEIDQNLSETFDNTDSPKSSPTYRKKSIIAENKRPHSAPVQKHGIPQRIGSRSVSNSASRETTEVSGIQKYSSSTHSTNTDFSNTDNVNRSGITRNSMRQKSGSDRSSRSSSVQPSFSSPVREVQHRVSSPSNMRPYSYPARKEKPNINIDSTSQSMHSSRSTYRAHELRSRSPAYTHSRKPLPVPGDYASLAHKITNIKFEDAEYQEQPVNYSLKYSDESASDAHSSTKNTVDSKIPLPKLNNYVDETSMRPSAIVPPLYIKDISQKHGSLPKVTMRRNKISSNVSSAYSPYAETDLDNLDQVVDYSQKYQEIPERLNNASYSASTTKTSDSKLRSNFEDTVKVYCTEDTPVNFSSASSLTDLCDASSLASQPREDLVENHHNVQAPITYPDEQGATHKTADEEYHEKNSSASKDREGKSVKFGEEVNCTETPLMFSRCSSLGSLSSFDQPSIQDDRSSVSDFSRMTSGIISPSDLPDSPSQTMPPSPHQKKRSAFSFDEKQDERNVPSEKPKDDNIVVKASRGPFDDEKNTYRLEGTPVEFSTASSLSSLSIENDQEHQKASIIKNMPHSRVSNGTHDEVNTLSKHSHTKVENRDLRDHRIPSVGVQKNTEFDTSTDTSFNKMNGMRHLWNDSFTHNIDDKQARPPVDGQQTKQSNFGDDTIKVYCTEGTPNLSHSASFSDLSMLSFNAEKNVCERSLEDSCDESESSCDDGCNFPSAPKNRIPLENMKVDSNTLVSTNFRQHNNSGNDARNIAPSSPHEFQVDSHNSSICQEENELLLQCIKSGMPKPKAKLSASRPSLESKNIVRHCPGQMCYDKSGQVMSGVVHEEAESSVRKLAHKLRADDDDSNDEKLCKEIVEGTPVSFSRNSSLSSLSIESLDVLSPEKPVLPSCIPLGMKKNVEDVPASSADSLTQGSLDGNKCFSTSSDTKSSSIPSAEGHVAFARSKASVFNVSDSSAQQNETCMGNRLTGSLGFESLKRISTQNVNNTMVEHSESEKNALYEKALLSECLNLNKAKQQEFYTDDQSNQLHKSSLEYTQKVFSQAAPSQKLSAVEKVQSIDKSSAHFDACDKVEADINSDSYRYPSKNFEETQLSSSESELLQKCILSGKPKPKHVAHLLRNKTSNDVDNASKSEVIASVPSEHKHRLVGRTDSSSNIPLSQNHGHIIQGRSSAPKVEMSRELKFTRNQTENNENNLALEAEVSKELSPFEKDLLQQCILSGMPKKTEHGSDISPKKLSKMHAKSFPSHEDRRPNYQTKLQNTTLPSSLAHVNQASTNASNTELHQDPELNVASSESHVEDSVLMTDASKELSQFEKDLLQKCILSGMPKKTERGSDGNSSKRPPKSHVKSFPIYCDKTTTSETHDNSLSCENDSPELSVAEKELLQKCILSGMPQKRSRTLSNPASLRRKHLENSPEQASKGPSVKNSVSSNALACDKRELSSSQELLLHQCILSGMPMKRAPEATGKDFQNSNPSPDLQNQKIHQSDSVVAASEESSKNIAEDSEILSGKTLSEFNKVSNMSQPELTSDDEALLQKCILSGMPKPKNPSQVKKNQQELKSGSYETSQSQVSKMFKCADDHEAKVVSAAEKILLSAPSKLVAESSGEACASNEEKPNDDQEMLNIRNEDCQVSACTNSNLKDTSELERKDSSPECSENVDVSDSAIDLLLEAQKLADDMLEAVVDSTEDMTVSTLSCLSDIDNVTPPSAMGELASLSLTNSGFGDDIKQPKSGKLNLTSSHKKSLLRELQLNRLGSDVDSEFKSKLSDSTLSLSMKSSSGSTDIIENINPPSVLDDMSLTASTTSLNSLPSNILDSKFGEKVEQYACDDNSMNERMCEAAAMAQMYTKELSNITGVKNTDMSQEDIHCEPAVCHIMVDAFEDITEPACDTIASDIEFVDELPCDDDDPGSETLLAPQLSSLNKDEPGEGSTENLTLTLTEEPPACNQSEENVDANVAASDEFDVLRENADLILSSLKKVHISESSDFGGLATNDLLEDETLSLVSNESDDDSLSPDGVFADVQGTNRSQASLLRSNKNGAGRTSGNSSPQESNNKCQTETAISNLPSCNKSSGRTKFGFVKSAVPDRTSHVSLKDSFVQHAVDSSNPSSTEVPINNSGPIASQQSIAKDADVPLKQPTDIVVDSRTFTRKKQSVHGIPTILGQQHSGVVKALKSPTFSSHESIESCSTSNSVSSLSSSGDTSSNKSIERKKGVPSRIVSIWKNNNKTRSKSSVDPGRNEKIAASVTKHYSIVAADRDRSLSPSLQRPHSQSSVQSLPQSSTDEKISAHQDSTQSMKRPTTLMLSRRNDLSKFSTKSQDSSPVAETANRALSKGLVKSPVSSPVSVTSFSRSSLPVRKSMIPTSSKLGIADQRNKTEQDSGSSKQKACVVTIV